MHGDAKIKIAPDLVSTEHTQLLPVDSNCFAITTCLPSSCSSTAERTSFPSKRSRTALRFARSWTQNVTLWTSEKGTNMQLCGQVPNPDQRRREIPNNLHHYTTKRAHCASIGADYGNIYACTYQAHLAWNVSLCFCPCVENTNPAADTSWTTETCKQCANVKVGPCFLAHHATSVVEINKKQRLGRHETTLNSMLMNFYFQ